MKLVAEIFSKTGTSPDIVTSNGIKFFLSIYNAPVKEVSIDNYRYSCFIKAVSKSKPVKLNSLPPTHDAAQQHFFRVYFQVQKWLVNVLNPKEWGWMLKVTIFWPKTTSQLPAPDCLLKIIFCNCTKGCGPLCGCRRLGLNCSPVCGNCRKQSCLNAQPIENSLEIEAVIEAETQSSHIDSNFLE